MSPSIGKVTTAVTCAVPTLLLAGQVSPENADWLHRSPAFGSPARPCGSSTCRLFRSSLCGFSENVVSMVRSGWPPAAVVDGCSCVPVMDTAAWAPAGSSTARSSTGSASNARGIREGTTS